MVARKSAIVFCASDSIQLALAPPLPRFFSKHLTGRIMQCIRQCIGGRYWHLCTVRIKVPLGAAIEDPSPVRRLLFLLSLARLALTPFPFNRTVNLIPTPTGRLRN